MNGRTTQLRGRQPYGSPLERIGSYFASVLLSLVILFWVTDLWNANFKVPLTYYRGGDLLWNASIFKGFTETGSYLVNPNLGAPFGLQSYDFPTSEAFHYLLLTLLHIFTGNYVATFNLLYVLSYPLTALTALWVFRKFDTGTIPAVACSLFYAFLVTHFWRGLMHLQLACYYLVPLLFWVVLTSSTPSGGQPSGGFKEMLKSRWFLGRLAVCVAIGSDGFYHSLFGAFFLACSGLFAWTAYKYRIGLLTSLGLACATLLTSLCNVLPNIIFWAREGMNQTAVIRESIAAEVYGLKITHIILPNVGHRVPVLAALRQFYLATSGINEASTTTGFGLIGGLGFICLLAYALFRTRNTFREYPFGLLGTLNLTGVLLATVGGFGSVLSFLGFKQIRAYNRISVFLAFLAFMAVALIWRKLEKSIFTGVRPVFVIVSLLVAVFGLWDEIPAGVAPNHALSKMQWMEDARYIATLESSTPPGSMIFQLPYVPFPEYPPVVAMKDYSHLRPYLHSKHLRWSYGTIKGRKGAAWMETTSTLSVPQMVKIVAGAGYAGIYIDRFGYTDHAAALESQLASLLGTTPIVSNDNRLCYFSLGALTNKNAGPLTSPPDVGVTTVESKWEGEFSGLEKNGYENWRWCGNLGILHLINRSKDTTWVNLNATVKTAWPEDAMVRVKSALFTDELVTNARGLEWERIVAVPPGDHLVTFTSSARKHPVSGISDPRVLVFALHDFTLTSVAPPVGGVTPKPLMQRPVELTWGTGAYSEETDRAEIWHWCSSACEVFLGNPSATQARVRIIMGISTGHDKPATFTIKGPGIYNTAPANSTTRRLVYTLDLPPGKTVFKMSCDAPRVVAPGDPRNMVFRVSNFSLIRVSESFKLSSP